MIHNMTQPKLFTRGNKLWIRFSFNGKVIKRPLHLDNSKTNVKIANLQIIPQLILKVTSGEFFENEKAKIPTVDEYAEISFTAHEAERKPTTTVDYRNIYRKHIQPYFGNVTLDKIKASEVSVWKNKLYKNGLSSRRVNAIKKVFGTIVQDAVDDEVVLSNPVRKSKALPPHIEKSIIPFSLDEVGKILEAAEGQDKNLIATLFMTGVRTGELIALKWENVDLDNRTIDIVATIGRGLEGLPKTKSSVRTIPILDSLYDYLVDQYAITGQKKSYVFLNPNDSHFFDSKNLRNGLWKKVLKKADIKYRTIYQTRHTFCSLHLQDGSNLAWVSKVMGHKNSKITLEKYSKFVPSDSKISTVFDKL
ncbi:tyrosine-type recombinase/integrase [Sulfurimonas sp.]|uniref:tyrosine-type recombinase/integrase n=1 Tax=Sulfurimonas sp. TaxID=2022749 RepID=UPI0035646117